VFPDSYLTRIVIEGMSFFISISTDIYLFTNSQWWQADA